MSDKDDMDHKEHQRLDRQQHAEEEAEDIAQQLIRKGFMQTSRRHRMVARLPVGKGAFEALLEVDPRLAADFRRNFESICTSQYLRCYAEGENAKTLSREVFAAFLRLGGTTAR